MTSYVLTGGTGFVGRHLLSRLVRRPDAVVHVLVREQSAGRLSRLAAQLEGSGEVVPLLGDIRQDRLGLSDETLAELQGVDHVVHLAALYDMTAEASENEDLNVGGTRRVLDVATLIGAKHFHHVSSIAVAGEHRGTYTETMFDEGQELPSPYHSTKFEAERLVREQSAVPWRVYRPSIVVGDSTTGQMDKVDGPYYFLPLLTNIGGLPGARHLPLVVPDLGDSNVVPVDYVADAMDALMHADDLDGRAFHLAHPRMQPLLDVYNALARAARAPQVAIGLPRSLTPTTSIALGLLGQVPGLRSAAEVTSARLGIPPSVLPHSTFRPVFATDRTRQVLDTLGVAPPPELASYAQTLYDYWAENLDPLRARRRRNGSPLNGRTVVVTGASSGIGRTTALKIAERGGIPLLLARRAEELEKVKAEIEKEGGRAAVYTVDLTSTESIDACVKQMLADHDGIDMLVNNAGRSIRRSIRLSYDRFHDYERTMALNYFAPVRLVLALLPHMTQRHFGHIVNISSIGVQTNVPRFSAYVASKAALDAFSRVAATEVVGDGVTFTNIHMPLVRTPMIAPTSMYDRFPTLSPDQAADMIIGALERQPKHVGTRLGTTAVVANALAPKVVDAILHTAYLLFPDSTAAGGNASQRTETPEALSRGAVVLSRILPGVHW